MQPDAILFKDRHSGLAIAPHGQTGQGSASRTVDVSGSTFSI